jgi:hypothetical protein
MSQNSNEASVQSVVLLPCPFCGSLGKLNGVGEPGSNGDPTAWRAECENDCMSEQHASIEDASAAWNTRKYQQCFTRALDLLRELHDFSQPLRQRQYEERSQKAFREAAILLNRYGM